MWLWASVFSLTGLIVAVLVFSVLANQPVVAADITVYKSPACGCCDRWVDYLQENGFSVTVQKRQNMQSIKQELGVQPQYQSCHSAVVDDYVIEGHVPADDIRRLLEEKPAIHGLAVPGMPMGSPGMEGPHKDPYSVISIDKEGKSAVFSRH
jgi:hypothetical protein